MSSQEEQNPASTGMDRGALAEEALGKVSVLYTAPVAARHPIIATHWRFAA